MLPMMSKQLFAGHKTGQGSSAAGHGTAAQHLCVPQSWPPAGTRVTSCASCAPRLEPEAHTHCQVMETGPRAAHGFAQCIGPSWRTAS